MVGGWLVGGWLAGGWLEELELKQPLQISFGLGLCKILKPRASQCKLGFFP
jgi:hypothetical protein